MRPLIGILALGLVLALGAPSLRAAEGAAGRLPPPADKKSVTYAADIKPILDKACLECHGPAKAKGKLRLDSREGILKGSEDGKVVNVGQSDRSVLVLAVAHAGKKAMPPKDKAPALAQAQVGLIRAWIDQGAN